MRRGAELARELTAGDEVLVPILKQETCVGLVSLGEKTYGTRYGPDELAQLSTLSNQISVALDNIRLVRENTEKKVLEEELLIARRIQSQLLPSSSPDIPGYRLDASTIPSRQVGGDYYDFGLLDDDTLVLVVADVSGKGIPASLLMATLRAGVNSNTDAQRHPAKMLGRINTLLFHSTSPEEFATVFYGVMDLRSGEMKYANAGHEFPFVVGEDGVRQLRHSGIVLGCMLDYEYEEHACVLPAGGALVMYTDGVTDAVSASGESFGEERLRHTLGAGGADAPAGDVDSGADAPADLFGHILEDVARFCEDGYYIDDLTLMVLTRS